MALYPRSTHQNKQQSSDPSPATGCVKLIKSMTDNNRHPLITIDVGNQCMTINRLFAGQGHVTMSIIKIDVGTKWLPDMKRT